MSEEKEYNPELLNLVDDEGNEHNFEILDVLDLDGKQYFALIPYFDNPEDVLEDDAELVILRAVDDSEDSYLEVIEDDDEFNKVAAIFTDRLSETFEIEE